LLFTSSTFRRLGFAPSDALTSLLTALLTLKIREEESDSQIRFPDP
jgi:hypothetical protein